jgi:hypothetical protein
MCRVRLALLSALLAAFVIPAGAEAPTHIKLEPLPAFTVTGACDFVVEFAEVRVHGNLLDFFDEAGNFTKEIIAGNFVVRVTNVETGASLTLNISGQFVYTPNPDGSLTLAAHGRNLLFTIDPEPFVVFHRGRAVLTATPTEGFLELVFIEVSGRSADICAALA